jgi:hypothetical protein
MCDIIDIKNIDSNRKKIINHIKKILIKNKDNPKLKIDNIKIINNKEIIKNINIIQDGYLIAGTKQRVAKNFIKYILTKNKDRKIDTLLYAGTMNGFGPVACAYASYKLGLKSKVFLGGDYLQSNTRQINTLLALDSEITICPTYREARKLEWKISNNPNKKWNTLSNYYVVPLGLNDEEGKMINLLSKQIKKASKGTLLEEFIKADKKIRIWCVAGSGGIVASIRKAFPEAQLFIYLVYNTGSYSKKVIEWASKNNIIIINYNKEFDNVNNYNINNRKKYYSSVKNYDDLLWPYIKKYGKDNDFIWNVASDDLDIIL